MSEAAYAPPDAVEHHDRPGHVVPLPVLLAVFAALVVLTVATLAASWVDFDPWNLWIAMGIATLKATLVALYFMHLRYDHPFHAVILVTALVFVMIFIGLTLNDALQYQPDISNWR